MERFSCTCGIVVEWLETGKETPPKGMVWGKAPVSLFAMINLYEGTYKIYEQSLRGLNDKQREVLHKYLEDRRPKEKNE